ncbi:Bicaudal D-related protein homolog [Eumeta japonica]|uniref:Bicaudal D-related protein homolog n=1 Tax=Eumeta variegata TaxID=151549 RepID=A0A4C1TUL4_EUMVA|nr:Bicaudal D-related protein homolog [Eumeta japonica]
MPEWKGTRASHSLHCERITRFPHRLRGAQPPASVWRKLANSTWRIACIVLRGSNQQRREAVSDGIRPVLNNDDTFLTAGPVRSGSANAAFLSVAEVELRAAAEERDRLLADASCSSLQSDEVVARARQERDEAMERKKVAEVALAKTRVELMQANSQLYEAVRQRSIWANSLNSGSDTRASVCRAIYKGFMHYCDFIPDGHAGTDQRTDETQADFAGETPQAAGRRAADSHGAYPWIFSAVICCTAISVRRLADQPQAIETSRIISTTFAIIAYLSIVELDTLTFATTYGLVFIVISDRYSILASMVASTAILFVTNRLDALVVSAIFMFVAVIVCKPCDRYTFAVEQTALNPEEELITVKNIRTILQFQKLAPACGVERRARGIPQLAIQEKQLSAMTEELKDTLLCIDLAKKGQHAIRDALKRGTKNSMMEYENLNAILRDEQAQLGELEILNHLAKKQVVELLKKLPTEADKIGHEVYRGRISHLDGTDGISDERNDDGKQRRD